MAVKNGTTSTGGPEKNTLLPRSEAEVAEILRAASDPLVVRGGGTRTIGAPEGKVLSTRGLTGITRYEPGALTIVAAAGTPLNDIEAALAAENQRLAFEPPRLGDVLVRGGESTIGGVVAANASGPRRIQAGACRDALIGVRFVDGRGDVLKNGGRVMKNVTGYDLVKLMAGSHGSLGVLTEVAFKVLPGVASETTLKLPTSDAAMAVTIMSAALGSPYEVTGAAYAEGNVLLRLEGFESSVVYRAEQLTRALAKFGTPEPAEANVSRTLWAKVRDARAFTGMEGNLWRISVKPSDGSRAVDALTPSKYVMDWGGGLIWALLPEGADVRTRLKDIPGHATLLRGKGYAAFPPEAAGVAALSKGLRRQFDPKGLFRSDLSV